MITRAIITGMKGACGTYLARHLETQGIKPVPISRPECDLMDAEAVYDRVRFAGPEVIYHLAADANVREAFDKPVEVFTNNTVATINLFEAVRKARIDPIIMLASTSEVYGNPKEYPIHESASIQPCNPYAISKTACDLMAQMYARNYRMRVVIFRGFSYINPLRADLALSNFARQIVECERGNLQEIVHGNLDSVRAFCDVRDVVRGFAMTPDLNTDGGIYNIGGSLPVSIGECLEELIKLAKVPIKTRIDPLLMRPTDVTNQIPDCTRFVNRTGWQPEYTLTQSLQWLLDHYRQ